MAGAGRYGYWVDIAHDHDPDGHRRAVHTHTAAGVPAPRIHGIVGVPHPLRPEQRRAFDHAYYPGRCIVIPDGRPPGWQWRRASAGDEPARPAAVALGALRALTNIVRAVLVVAARLAVWPARRIIAAGTDVYREGGGAALAFYVLTLTVFLPVIIGFALHLLGAPW